MNVLDGKTVLITGGTGSFGRAFIRNAIQSTRVRKVIVFSRDELKQSEMQRDPFYVEHAARIRFFIGDVRDAQRLNRAFCDVHYVISAAAMKQVPACEYNPLEAKKTNIDGAQNVIDAAINCGVDKVIALSTDKATNPVNAYGASKLFAEKLYQASNAYSGVGGPRFACVRYGNVAGSRGSVIPAFRDIVKRGVEQLPITHREMTRFWFTLGEAVDLVLFALADMGGGETYVPKIPSFRVTDLADAMDNPLGWCEVGIRPGEKLHESMIGPDESHEFSIRDNCYVRFDHSLAERLRPGFDYSSGCFDSFLTTQTLRELLRSVA